MLLPRKLVRRMCYLRLSHNENVKIVHLFIRIGLPEIGLRRACICDPCFFLLILGFILHSVAQVWISRIFSSSLEYGTWGYGSLQAQSLRRCPSPRFFAPSWMNSNSSFNSRSALIFFAFSADSLPVIPKEFKRVFKCEICSEADIVDGSSFDLNISSCV